MTWSLEVKQRVRQLKSEMLALHLAMRHAGTPWYAKALVAGLVAYAFSPVDLIPDFIPVLGLLDDFLLLSLGVALAIRLVPAEVMIACRARALQAMQDGKPTSWTAGVVLFAVWLGLLALAIAWGYQAFSR